MLFVSEQGGFLKKVINTKNPCKLFTYRGFILGARWDSNPRHSEPQSDALTN